MTTTTSTKSTFKKEANVKQLIYLSTWLINLPSFEMKELNECCLENLCNRKFIWKTKQNKTKNKTKEIKDSGQSEKTKLTLFLWHVTLSLLKNLYIFLVTEFLIKTKNKKTVQQVILLYLKANSSLKCPFGPIVSVL